jgi:hypothetical protein
MAITRDELRTRRRDYFVARVEAGELLMEPFCWCGQALDDRYSCAVCNHKCECTFVACADPGALAAMEKLVRGTPEFGKFELAPLEA